jgi:hypothetical protein
MLLATKIRVGVLLVAALIFISGLSRAVDPGATFVGVHSMPSSGESRPAQAYPEFATSKSRRVFGVARLLVGGGLAVYIILPWWRSQSRSR